MAREALQRVTPILPSGERGISFVIGADKDPWTWTVENAQRYLDEGYVKLDFQPYERSTIVGDKRKGKR